ncbi:hypothetical protein MJO28_006437 [Puccinia striiformis f. sp. tritici]|nr:hypothetical protein Pst134EA_011607 [Puccinia striiformis f. sp. tritici]KAH9467986.1 hypothetical protein Pst134EA_011607 [Puccinia striiformis f. sp. tritici]KAI7953890.1 hypothetical protein MJO28_006437 [Puccinia striiformis f. sp. tritici]
MIAHFTKLQRSRIIPSDGLSLAHFVFQAKVKSLYRNILRETRCEFLSHTLHTSIFIYCWIDVLSPGDLQMIWHDEVDLGTNEIRRETISWIRQEFVKPMQGKLDERNNQDFISQINRQLKQIKNSSMLIGGEYQKLRGSR